MKLPKGISIRYGSYVAYLTKNGKPVRPVVGRVGCITPKQAAQERADLEKLIRDGKYPPAAPEPTPEPTQGPTVKNLWLPYLADCENRDKRTDRLKTAWTHLEMPFGGKLAASVKTQDMVEYTTERRAAGIMNGTVNRELAVLKATMRHGARSGVIERVPMFPKRLKESRPRQGFIGDSEYTTLRANARDLWLKTFVALGYYFGLRKGEILALRVRNIDLLEGWLTIEMSKNGEGRKIALTREASSLLAECVRGKKANDFLLTRQGGDRIVQPRKDWYSLCCRLVSER